MQTNTRSCFTCAFSETFVDENGRIDFNRKICFWGPPTPIMMATPQGTVSMTQFPMVAKTLWCHRHELREAEDVVEVAVPSEEGKTH